MSIDDVHAKHKENKERMESFTGKSSIVPQSKIDKLKKRLCSLLVEKYKNQESLVSSGVCGIVDARKICAYRFDFLTIDFLIEIINRNKIDIIKMSIFNSLQEKTQLRIKKNISESYNYITDDVILKTTSVDSLIHCYCFDFEDSEKLINGIEENLKNNIV